MSEPVLELMRALDFAAQKHSEQRRKGARQEPYVNHIIEVGRLLAAACQGRDLVLILGGILHDTLEDTETTIDELESTFGEPVARLVEEVSDDKRLPKSVRKELQVRNARLKSENAKRVKMADKISNLRSLRLSPPDGWNAERKLEYADWARRVVEECRGASSELEDLFDESYRELRAALGDSVSES